MARASAAVVPPLMIERSDSTVDVIILEPPAAPIARHSVELARNSTMIVVTEDRGRFPGATKLAGLGLNPKRLVVFGMEKSFISLFIMMPVSGTIICDPQKPLTVVVRVMAMP